MSVAKQLQQLQEVDLELETNEQALRQTASQLGESQAVISTRAKVTSENQRLEELKHQQHSLEWEIEDLTSKINTTQDKLYGGSIKNPKELANLQHEVEVLQSKREQLEDKTLEIMEQVELTESSIATIKNELSRLEIEWQEQQQRLFTNLDKLKAAQSNLQSRRQVLSTSIDFDLIEFYDRLRKEKGTAVAKIEQGICRGCRISISAAELQQARSGSLVQCSNCGRILFLA